MPGTILCVDPGSLTGFVLADIDTAELIYVDELSPLAFERLAHDWASTLGVNLLTVCERFTITQRTIKASRAGSVDAIEITGVLRYLSQTYCRRDLIFQLPSEVMTLISDDRLKRLGWYKSGKGYQGHANDALRHLAFWLAKNKGFRLPT